MSPQSELCMRTPLQKLMKLEPQLEFLRAESSSRNVVKFLLTALKWLALIFLHMLTFCLRISKIFFRQFIQRGSSQLFFCPITQNGSKSFFFFSDWRLLSIVGPRSLGFVVALHRLFLVHHGDEILELVAQSPWNIGQNLLSLSLGCPIFKCDPMWNMLMMICNPFSSKFPVK